MIAIPEDLAEVNKHVIEKEAHAYNKIYDEISHLEDLKLRYQYAAKLDLQLENDTDMQEEVSEKFDNLQEALIKQACFTNLTRNLLYNNEIQKAVMKDLSSLDINEDLEDSNKLFQLLKNSAEAVDYSAEISKVTEECNEMQCKVFRLNKKYMGLLHSIDNKWAILKGRKIVVDSGDDKLKALHEKVERRETRLRVLVELLKNIISVTDVQWQEDSREVQTLLLCDAFSCENTEDITESLALLRAARNAPKDTQRKITSYLHSTAVDEN